MPLNNEELPIKHAIRPGLTDSNPRWYSPRGSPMESKACKVLTLLAMLLLLGLQVYNMVSQRFSREHDDSSALLACRIPAANASLPEASHSIEDNPAVKLVQSWQVDYWAQLPCSGSTNWRGGYTGRDVSGCWSVRYCNGISFEEDGFKFCFYPGNDCASRGRDFRGERTCLDITQFQRFRVEKANEDCSSRTVSHPSYPYLLGLSPTHENCTNSNPEVQTYREHWSWKYT